MADGGENRFEFRCFFLPREVPAAPLPGLSPAGEPELPRRDTYLLLPHEPRLLPKLRDGARFEVKRLAALAGRLEGWEVVASAAFPLDREALALAGRLFDRSHRGLSGACAGDFLDSLARHGPGTRAIDVEKRRRRLSGGPLLGEVTHLLFPAEGTRLATVAVESADLAALDAFLEGTPLGALPNLNYGAFLRWHARTGIHPVSRPR